MPEKLSLREQYGKTLAELGKDDRNIVVLDADLAGSTKTSIFGKEFPDRFFNMGVSEQDMMSTAAGLASGGKTAFASTFAIFATGRAWEQVRQSICYPKLNVKVVSTHGGITVGPDGPSHHATEDIAVMRAIPNQTVIVPVDAYETAAAVKWAASYKGPVYIRLTREKFPVIFDESKSFEAGKSDSLRKGSDATIIACGLMTHMALEAASLLEKEGISVGVINMSSIKPIDKEAVIAAARESGAIVTAEEHNVVGGLGGAVAEVTAENAPVPVVKIGVQDMFATSGDADGLLKTCGLTTKDIMSAVKRAMEIKAS